MIMFEEAKQFKPFSFHNNIADDVVSYYNSLHECLTLPKIKKVDLFEHLSIRKKYGKMEHMLLLKEKMCHFQSYFQKLEISEASGGACVRKGLRFSRS